MAPFLHHLTRRLGGKEGGKEGRQQQEGGREGGLEVDLFFSHDSSVLPVVALLDLVRVGRREEGGREGGREGRGGKVVSFFSKLG
jgi:hypothetical protein